VDYYADLIRILHSCETIKHSGVAAERNVIKLIELKWFNHLWNSINAEKGTNLEILSTENSLVLNTCFK
jgi:hypothetical protein